MTHKEKFIKALTAELREMYEEEYSLLDDPAGESTTDAELLLIFFADYFEMIPKNDILN